MLLSILRESSNEKCYRFTVNIDRMIIVSNSLPAYDWFKSVEPNYHKVNRDKKAKTGKSLFVAFLANFGEFILSGYLTNLTQIWPVVSNTPQLQHRISELLFYFSLSRTASLDVRNTDPNYSL